MVDNQIFGDESFRIGVKTGKIKNFGTFCEYYDFNLTSDEMEVLMEAPATKPIHNPIQGSDYLDKEFP
jgi:hypothetical protein